ncbi:hypothetical protein cypCar_00048361, partial [Cyprinus carpio]
LERSLKLYFHRNELNPFVDTHFVEIKEPSTGPSVFCGVGLALGLLDLATGDFFIAKGYNYNDTVTLTYVLLMLLLMPYTFALQNL